jgi:cytochrome c-type biogenesis protein
VDDFAAWLSPYLVDGSLLALPLVVVGGLITAFNPCCLPMYPAVLGFMGRSCQQSETDKTGRTITGTLPIRTALIFVLGMAAATTLMGLLTASMGWVFGRFDPIILMFLALVPTVMGLHMLGLLPIRIPTWHIQRLHDIEANRLKHAVTAFGVGFLFSLAIAPCATPILLGILTLVAMQGDLVWGGALMFIYGLGTGLPLLLIGHSFERIQPWLTMPHRQRGLRYISGLLLLGVGVYVLWSV